ncbi:MAG: endonuclease/exonuclease/phosphatase family protein [Tepidisphaeraceae bacterium]
MSREFHDLTVDPIPAKRRYLINLKPYSHLGSFLSRVLGPRFRHATRSRRRFQFAVLVANALYFGLLAVLWIILQLAADSWWIATLILFGPRWVFGVPLLLLLPAVLITNRRMLVLVVVEIFLLMFGIMDFRVPWRTVIYSQPTGPHLRLISCNIHRTRLLAAQFSQLIDQTNPDVVALQEWTSQDQAALFSKGRWFLRRDGELFLASRTPIKSAQDLIQGQWGPAGSAVYYQVDFNGGELNLINLHLASPHIEFADAINGAPQGPDEVANNSAARSDQSTLIANFARSLHAPTILLGDFNTPADSPIFQNSWIDDSDAFGIAGWGIGHTYFTRFSSVRIDHILAPAAWQVTSCWVGPDEGSPHHPVIADLEWVDPAGWNAGAK